MEAGTAANYAEERKRHKSAALGEAHQFEPIAVDTMGVYSGSTRVILRAIYRRAGHLVEVTEERREDKIPSKPGYSCSVRQCVQYSLSRYKETF